MNQNKTYAINFAPYIQERTAGFTGRNWVFERINAWLDDPGVARFFLLTGEPGSGKTAIAARLAQFSTGQTNPPPGSARLGGEFLSAIHFCRAAASDWTDPRTFARSISLQLAAIPEFATALKDIGDKEINIDVHQETGAVAAGGTVTGVLIQNLVIRGLNGQEAFNRVVLDPLRTIYNGDYDKPILILVDSLDEALTSMTDVTIVDLLAGLQGLDERVRFILTSRAEPRVEVRFLEYAPDGLFLSDPAFVAENNKDIGDYVAYRFDSDAKLKSQAAALTPTQSATLSDLITAKAEGNFMYVTFLLQAVAEGQQALDNLADLPFGLDALYASSLERIVKLGKKTWNTAYKPLLGMLSVAQEPLTLAQLETYAKLPGKGWDILMDLWQYVETTAGSEPVTNGEEPSDRYRLYHQSVIDFLRRPHVVHIMGGKKKTSPNRYWIEANPWHERVVACCKGKASTWDKVDWSKVDSYSLRHLAGHLYQLRADAGRRAELHALVQSQPFIDRRLQGAANPTPVLDDLRLALDLALQSDDLAQAWTHIHKYRCVLREQYDFQRLLETVKEGQYALAEERTTLYSALPNAQVLTRLWIAWHAATNGRSRDALDLVKRTLDRLPPRGLPGPISRKADKQVSEEVGNAVAETLRRLLVRIARAAEPAPGDPKRWLEAAVIRWDQGAAVKAVQGLDDDVITWGDILDAANLQQPMQDLLDALKASGRIDADASGAYDRGMMYRFQRQLAAGLFNSQDDPRWLDYISQTVSLVEQDDYLSYREIALAWVAVAILAQADDELACLGLALVLDGMFKPSPGFWGDTVAAAMDGMAVEGGQASDPNALLSYLELVEATGERSIDPTVNRKLPDIVAWRERVGLPKDPWSFSMRRRSAVAAVLYRRHECDSAKSLLEEACAEGHWGSYAGYRSLARLSLACRWLEWRRLPEARQQTTDAQSDAFNVRDSFLQQERLDLVAKTRAWIEQYGPQPEALTEAQALALAQQKTGMERGLYIEFLSALWCAHADRLKRLLLLTLDDATSADAVLGRLLGIEARNLRPGRPFLALVKTFDIGAGME
jgi:hypothetical protein